MKTFKVKVIRERSIEGIVFFINAYDLIIVGGKFVADGRHIWFPGTCELEIVEESINA